MEWEDVKLLTTIECTAENLLVQARQNGVPTNMDTVISLLDMSLTYKHDLSAVCQSKFNEGSKQLVLHTDLSPLRKRFAIAHAIGHYVLKHGAGFTDQAADYNSAVNSKVEQQANHFALALLIPEAHLRCLIDVDGYTSIKELSNFFIVSEAAVIARLKYLGYLKTKRDS